MNKSNNLENFGLSLMFKAEIIVNGESKSMISAILKDIGIVGFTILDNVSGYGHSGYHDGRSLYNDNDNQVMFIAVGSEDVIQKVVKSMNTFFTKHSGVMFISDVAVTRRSYFLKEENMNDSEG